MSQSWQHCKLEKANHTRIHILGLVFFFAHIHILKIVCVCVFVDISESRHPVAHVKANMHVFDGDKQALLAKLNDANAKRVAQTEDNTGQMMSPLHVHGEPEYIESIRCRKCRR